MSLLIAGSHHASLPSGSCGDAAVHCSARGPQRRPAPRVGHAAPRCGSDRAAAAPPREPRPLRERVRGALQGPGRPPSAPPGRPRGPIRDVSCVARWWRLGAPRHSCSGDDDDGEFLPLRSPRHPYPHRHPHPALRPEARVPAGRARPPAGGPGAAGAGLAEGQARPEL